MKIFNETKYDEKIFTHLFDVTNKIEIKNICIDLLSWSLSNEDVKNICAKIEDKITRSLFSNDVSCFV